MGGNPQDRCWAIKRGRATGKTVEANVKNSQELDTRTAEGEHGRQSGRGRMVSAAKNTGLGSSRVRRKKQ